MNKKITAVTLTALMVLTMFTALVPTASAVIEQEVASPYEFYGAVMSPINNIPEVERSFNLTSEMNPSILYYDFDDSRGAESLNFTIDNTALKVLGDSIDYRTSIYTDKDTGQPRIAWLGQPYHVVDNSTDFYVTEILMDDELDDAHLLRVGESLTLEKGFAITPLEIDVDGGEAWFSITQDGEEVDSTVEYENQQFSYDEDLNESGDKDNWILRFNVETVFAGMNTNLVKINQTQLISPDVLKIESGDSDTINDFEINFADNMETITIERDKADDDFSLSKGGIKSFMGRFNIRVNDDGDAAAVTKVVVVGGGVVATETGTAVATEEPIDEPTTNVTGTEVGAPTEGPTADTGETEVPAPEPTPEPGFEAVFAVAGLLAVAYLVLRQRE